MISLVSAFICGVLVGSGLLILYAAWREMRDIDSKKQ